MSEEQQQGMEPMREEKSSNKKTIIIVIAVIVVLVIILAFRSFSTKTMTENMIENATGGNAELNANGDEGTMKIKGADGNEITVSSGENLSIPDTWPADLPIMDGATITYTGSMSGQTGGSGTVLTLSTPKSVKEVADYYTSALKDNGWSSDVAMQMGEGTMLAGSKDDRSVSVVIDTGDDGQTNVSITVGTQ